MSSPRRTATTCRLLRADVLPHVARLNDELAAAGIPLSVLPGSEIQVTDTAAYRREFEAGLYCHLGDGRAFTLLEFSWKPEQYPPDATGTGRLAPQARHDADPRPPRAVRILRRRSGAAAGAGRGGGVAPGDRRFAARQPRAGPEGGRGGIAAGVPRRGAGDRCPQPAALFRVVGRLRLGAASTWGGACRALRVRADQVLAASLPDA